MSDVIKEEKVESSLSGKELSLVIPIYNEENMVDDLFERLANLRKALPECEVIVVNDGSTDKTKENLEKESSSPWVILHQETNMGYGAALKRGIRASCRKFVAICDADGTYPVDRIPEFYRLAIDEKLDMVIGARTGGNVNIPLIRRPAKWVLRKLANYLSGHSIPDLNSGLRLMKKSEIERFYNILPSGFSFTTTITLAMLPNHLAVRLVPIDYFVRTGSSKIHPIKDVLNFIQLICRTILYFNPLRIFVPLSILCMLAAFASLGLTIHFLGQAADVTFGVLITASIQVLAVGLLADMIDKRLQ